MRALSEAQARKCENAVHPRCKCRCGGKSHGAGRIAPDAPVAEYRALPDDDPHKLPPPPEPRGTMIRRLRTRNPGGVILYATKQRLLQMWDKGAWCSAERIEISEAIALVDLAISRVNSTLEA